MASTGERIPNCGVPVIVAVLRPSSPRMPARRNAGSRTSGSEGRTGETAGRVRLTGEGSFAPRATTSCESPSTVCGVQRGAAIVSPVTGASSPRSSPRPQRGRVVVPPPPATPLGLDRSPHDVLERPRPARTRRQPGGDPSTSRHGAVRRQGQRPRRRCPSRRRGATTST